MKKILYSTLLCLVVLSFSRCGMSQKAQIENLGKCNYTVESLHNVKVAGRDLSSFSGANGGSLASLPAIALSLLQQNLPFEANVNLKIDNPTAKRASINQFKYIIEMYGKPLFEGEVNENINLAQNESMVVPLTFKANLFGIGKEQGFDKVINDIFTRKSDAFISLKIKPSVKIAGKNYYYPGYITVDKDLGRSLSKSIK